MIAKVLIFGIRLYQIFLSPVLQFFNGGRGTCRFEPNCSRYAIRALRLHGPWRGSWLAIKRISRCHPWGGCGYDPVPEPGCGCGKKDCGKE